MYIWVCVPVFAKSLQSHLTFCNPMDCSLPGSSVPGILQARILEWFAVSFSRESSQPRGPTCVSWSSCIADGFFTTEQLGTSIHVCVCVCVYTLFQIRFCCGLSQDTEYSSLCYAVGPCCLCFIYSSMYLSVTNSYFIPPPHFPFGHHKFVFYVCESISVL